MTFLFGCLLWSLAAVLFLAAMGRRRPWWRPNALRLAGGLLLLAGAALFLFRPEEEMAAGEDPAAYLNTALTFARRGELFFSDPGLAEIAATRRPLFRYGHTGFGFTKDACLWVKDAAGAVVGPWFQPAYPLLMSVPPAVGLPYGAFLVAPLFALLSALLLARLAQRLTGKRRMGVAAFILFLLHPAIAWNARCLRPEIPAGFFLLAGIALLATPPRTASWRRGIGFLAGLSFPIAILLHITAVYVALPALLLAAWQTRKDRFWLGWWCGSVVGVVILAVQTAWITDPYGVLPLWTLPDRRRLIGMALAAFLVVLAVLPACRPIVQRFLSAPVRPQRHTARSGFGGAREQVAGLVLAAAWAGFVVWIFLKRDPQGHVPGLPRWLTPYLSLTDFRGVLGLCSRAWSAIALAGMVALAGGRGARGTLGRRLCVLLGPASLTIGWMVNYMFETRRTVTALVPLMVLCTIALINVLERIALRCLVRWRRAGRLRRVPGFSPRRLVWLIPCLAILALSALAFRGRAPLYLLWDRKGTYAFYRELAQRVAQEGDFLFAEYTQTAAPVEHLTGLPLLPVAWRYRTESEYRAAEQTIAGLVRDHPERRYLLITPFSGTALPGLALEPLFSRTLHTRVLTRGRVPVPTAVQDRTLDLYVFRLRPDGRHGELPYIRLFGESLFGVSGAATFMPRKTLETRGVPVGHGEPVCVRLVVAPPPDGGGGRLALVFAVDVETEPKRIDVESGGQALAARRYRLCPGWEIVEIDPRSTLAAAMDLRITSSAPVHLTDIIALDGGATHVTQWSSLHRMEPFAVANVDSRWVRADASLALPTLAAPGWVWVYASNGRTDGVAGTVTLRRHGDREPRHTSPLTEGWAWHVFPLAASSKPRGVFEWYDLQVEPAWNSGLHGFPSDLGLRIHAVVVRPCYDE